MRKDFYFDSNGIGQIHVCRWLPDTNPIGIVQIIHGIAEYAERYDHFARFLNEKGFIVVAEDHMGHGKSINSGSIQGFFHKGWFAAVDDSYKLLAITRQEYPNLPYVLFGHSMGSFMARSILCRYPDSGISAAIICGTGWQPRQMLPVAIKISEIVCRKTGEQKPSETLQNIVFGGYNKKVEHPRTAFDWLSRDARNVDAYIADSLCGFTASCGLLRDMLTGIRYIESQNALNSMYKELPVFFIAGGDDPVGSYGKGVQQAVREFQKIGMQNVSCKLYPMARHEILNEINKKDVYQDVFVWIQNNLSL